MGGPSTGAGLNPYMFPQQQATTGLAPGMPQPRGQMPPGMDIRALVQSLLASRQQGQGIGQMIHGMNPMAQKQGFPGQQSLNPPGPAPAVQQPSLKVPGPMPAVQQPKIQSSSQTLNPYK